MHLRALGWAAAVLVAAAGFAGASSEIPNAKIDAAGFLRMTAEASAAREGRRLSEKAFLAAARESGTVLLDARSRDRYEQLHVRGALSLPFTDFTAESLARAIPDSTTRVLIYCNNNFAGAEEPFPTKAPPAALNLSTYVALWTYGYRNVYELGPLVEVATTTLPLEGTLAR
jgi:hypothetical protein